MCVHMHVSEHHLCLHVNMPDGMCWVIAWALQSESCVQVSALPLAGCVSWTSSLTSRCLSFPAVKWD